MPARKPAHAALRTARLEAALRQSELADRERLVLGAYVHFESVYGGACGRPGLCWPTDAEMGEYLGRSDLTIRRARRRLAEAPPGRRPFITIEYVPPFHLLPNGQKTWHGANVITLLDLAEPIAPAAPELAKAAAELEALERKVARARARVEALAAAAADPQGGDDGSSHNAPLIIPEWSHVIPLWPGRGGEPRSLPQEKRAA
jgi:hypothetical protein